jgi:release factor glutamine methyltransferase
MYFSRPRKYEFEGVEVVVQPGVFPPHFTMSTKVLLEYLREIDLKDKSLLELGCGSGILSLFAASKGAEVTATDINEIALNTLKSAARNNKLPIRPILSDLFDNISTLHFDYIIINPPYFPKNPSNVQEMAWFCGENFEYFEKLFEQIRAYLPGSESLMILSEDCDLQSIMKISEQNGITLTKILERKFLFETQLVYRLTSPFPV